MYKRSPGPFTGYPPTAPLLWYIGYWGIFLKKRSRLERRDPSNCLIRGFSSQQGGYVRPTESDPESTPSTPYTHTHTTHMHAHMYTHVHICIHTYHLYTHTTQTHHTHTCTHIYTYIPTCIPPIHTYTHTLYHRPHTRMHAYMGYEFAGSFPGGHFNRDSQLGSQGRDQ